MSTLHPQPVIEHVGEPHCRRFSEQRWTIDNIIQANGIDWDQARSFYLQAPCGIESLADFAAIRQRVKKMADIGPAFEATARRREQRARLAEEADEMVSARENYFMAAVHWGASQWTYDENNEQNIFLNQKKRACYANYARLADHRVEPVWIPFKDTALPAWYHLPPDYVEGQKVPAVVAIPGMDSFKECAVALNGDRWLNRGIAVLAQGGFVVDLERDEVLRTVGLPRDQAAAVIGRIEEVAGDLIVAVEDAAEQAEVSGPLRVQHGFNWPYPEPAYLLPRNEVLPPGPVLKVFLRSSTLGQDELLARAKRVVDPKDAEVTHAGLGFIEVLPPGITKASGLAVALERYGVGFGDVLVFGDMPNDLPMFGAVTQAGGRAVAVANAHPAVRAATPHVTDGHDAEGVAHYLEAVLGV